MSGTPDAFFGPKIKIDRARYHMEAYKRVLQTLDGTPFIKFGIRSSPVVGGFRLLHSEGEFYAIFQGLSPLPLELRLSAADALYNLRSALDQAACACVSEPFKRDTYFPHGASPASFEANLGRQGKHFSPATIRAVRDIEPYRTGKGSLLRALHDLNIVDKHSALLKKSSTVSIKRIEPRPEFPLGIDESPGDAANLSYQKYFITNDGTSDDGPKVWARVTFCFQDCDEIKDVPVAKALEDMCDLVQTAVEKLELSIV